MATEITALLSGATTTGAGVYVRLDPGVKTFQVYGTTTSGAGSATVKIQGSNDGLAWDDIDAGMSLTLATTLSSTSSDSYTSDDRYAYHRANVTAISGTGARVSGGVSQ